MNHITDSEQKILKLLWEEGTLSTMQIVERLEEETGWSKHAVISFLKRMEAKGFVTYETQGRAKYYTPVPSQELVARQERDSVLRKFYHGKLGLMVSSMAEENSLTQEDIQDLRKLLDDLQESGENPVS
ncbi:MAG: BlaI/MecI/CopY family transcriptional regulator [Lachnospiraceae bacterium]|nr:BlaI/MecI/CopY family transcriptional regulator [Lachnospiraceae bacterium]